MLAEPPFGHLIVMRPPFAVTEAREITAEPPTEEIKAALDGGWLELVPGFDSIEIAGTLWRCVAFCDEEGKLKQLELNQIATAFWQRALARNRKPFPDHLVGPVVVLAGNRAFMEALRGP